MDERRRLREKKVDNKHNRYKRETKKNTNTNTSLPMITKSSIMLHGRKVVTSGSGISTVPPVAVAVTLSLASPKQ